jgi:hypothetical protein
MVERKIAEMMGDSQNGNIRTVLSGQGNHARD